MSELSNLSFLIAKNSKNKASANRRRCFSETIIRRRLEIVKIKNSPYCVLLKYSHLAKILKCSEQTVMRDFEFLAAHKLLMPLHEPEIPYIVTETAQQYTTRFLLANGLES